MRRWWIGVAVAVVLVGTAVLYFQQDDDPWVWVDGGRIEGTPLVVEQGGWRKLGQRGEGQRWMWRVEVQNESGSPGSSWKGNLSVDGELIEQAGTPVIDMQVWSDTIEVAGGEGIYIYRRQTNHRAEFVENLKPRFRVWAGWACRDTADDPWAQVDSVFSAVDSLIRRRLDSAASDAALETCYSDTLIIWP